VVLDGEAMCFTGGMHDFDQLWGNCFDDTSAARLTLADAFLDEAVLCSSGERLAILAHGCGFAALLDRARLGSSGKRLAILAERFGRARLRHSSAG